MSNRWVRFRWPSSFKGDPREFGERAGLVVRRDGDALRATTVDQYNKGSAPRLLRFEQVVDERNRQDDRWRQLVSNWTGAGEDGRGMEARVNAEIRRLLRLDDDSQPSHEEYFEAARLHFLCLPNTDLCNWIAEGCLPTLAGVMPAYRFCLVSYSDQIHTRMAYIRALFAGEHAPEWFDSNNDDRTFGAARGLGGEGLQGSTRFVDPLLGAHAPWMFGTSLPRIRSGFAVVLFGMVVAGRSRMRDVDLIETLTTNHLSGDIPVRAPATPTIATDAAEDALRWWIDGLNQLVAHVLDPTLFADSDGWYQPHQHLGYILTVERLFASVVSLLVHTGRDEYTRRTHLFEALDLIEGLSLGGYDRTLDPSLVNKHVTHLEQALPGQAAQVVLPRCRAAVEGLQKFRDDFHPRRLVDDKTIAVTHKDGRAGAIGTDKATTSYLRIVRNAGHGLRTQLNDPHSLSLLAAHEGNLPAAISDVPYLNLACLIADPDLMIKPLLRRQTAIKAP